MYGSTSKGRKINPFLVYIARVIECGDDGFGVSFLKEKREGFYITTENTEESYYHSEEELVVLENPCKVLRNRVHGFLFPSI